MRDEGRGMRDERRGNLSHQVGLCAGDSSRHGHADRPRGRIQQTAEEDAMPVIKSVIQSDPDILSGAPVFTGTRVPLQNLIDYQPKAGVNRRLRPSGPDS